MPDSPARKRDGSVQQVDRTASGGKFTEALVIYGDTVLPAGQMDRVGKLLVQWSLRSNSRERKFSKKLIPLTEDVVRLNGGDADPAMKISIIEPFLYAVRGPYGRQHLTEQHTTKTFPQTVVNFVYTLVADPATQAVLWQKFPD